MSGPICATRPQPTMNKPPPPRDPSEPGEVSLRAAITDSSLSVAARSRMITALDRLGGALIGIPAAWLERKEAEICNRSSIEAVVQDVSPELEGPILTDTRADALITDQALLSQLTPLINKIRVAEHAVALLSQENQGEEEQESDADTEPLEQDWLTHFACYAEKASSDEVRNLWAKVLAGAPPLALRPRWREVTALRWPMTQRWADCIVVRAG